MKKNVALGFDRLLTPEPKQEPAVQGATTEARERKEYKTVCYSIAPSVADKMRYIARYDRKKINEVVTEAFEAYIKQWEPTNEKPVKL